MTSEQRTGRTLLEDLVEAERLKRAAFETVAAQFSTRREGFGLKVEAVEGGTGILIVGENHGDGASSFKVDAKYGPWLRDQLNRIFPVTF